MTEVRKRGGGGRFLVTALALVALVTILAGVYLIDRVLGMPGRAVETGREIAADFRDFVAAFQEGEVETSFVSYASELAANQKLQVAELRQVEIFTRTESSAVLWGTLALPDVVVEARVPVEYIYTLDLADNWRFDLEDHRLTVTAPAITFNTPALDVSRLEYDVRESSLLRDENAALEILKDGLTELSQQRAHSLIPLVRETARRQTEEFVAVWLSSAFDQTGDFSIEVLFEGEPPPGEGAVLSKSTD